MQQSLSATVNGVFVSGNVILQRAALGASMSIGNLLRNEGPSFGIDGISCLVPRWYL